MTHAPHRVLQFLKDFAQERKLAWQQDSVGNIVIKRAGSGGGEHAPPVVIQVQHRARMQRLPAG